MQIVINNGSMVPVYEQLMDQIKQEIIGGGLSEGEALPSVRSLANELKISALTVKKAYDKLKSLGYPPEMLDITTIRNLGGVDAIMSSSFNQRYISPKQRLNQEVEMIH